MYIFDAAGGRLVLGQDVFCFELDAVGKLMGIQHAARKCWVRLRHGAVVCVQAAQVRVASWAQIRDKTGTPTCEVNAR